MHRFFSTQNPEESVQCGRRMLLWLLAKGEGNGCVEKLVSVLDFTRCLAFNLLNEPEI